MALLGIEPIFGLKWIPYNVLLWRDYLWHLSLCFFVCCTDTEIWCFKLINYPINLDICQTQCHDFSIAIWISFTQIFFHRNSFVLYCSEPSFVRIDRSYSTELHLKSISNTVRVFCIVWLCWDTVCADTFGLWFD